MAELFDEQQGVLCKLRPLDARGDGTVGFDEMLRLLGTLGSGVTEKEMRKLLEASGMNPEGRLDLAGFVRVLAGCWASPECPGNVGAARRAFGSTACLIERTQDRGLTLSQLRRVLSFAQQHCATWFDMAPGKFSKTAGQPLDISFLNLYHLTDWLIKPATRGLDNCADCSFVELLAVDAEGQRPDWYVSHWWGEAVGAFVRSCEAHAALRGEPGGGQELCYWVCAYANRQHSLGGDITEDPEDSSFRNAMRGSVGTLLILDSAVTPFRRIWCDFELIKTLEEPPPPTDAYNFCDDLPKAQDYGKLLDIVGEDASGSPQVLVDGTLPSESTFDKVEREKRFNSRLLTDHANIRLELGESTMESDKVHILSSIQGFKGKELDNPEVTQPSRLDDDAAFYNQYNIMLRARMAIAAWPILLTAPRHERAWVHDSLRQDLRRTSLVLDFSTQSGFDGAEYAVLAECLPPRLTDFSLIIAGCPVDDSGASAVGRRLEGMHHLRRLTLGHSHAPGLTDAGVAKLAAGLPASLEDLHVCLVGVGGDSSFTDAGVIALARGVSKLKGLCSLWLNLMENARLGAPSIVALAGLVHRLPRLRQLRLGLDLTQPVNRRLHFKTRDEMLAWAATVLAHPDDPAAWRYGDLGVPRVWLGVASAAGLLKLCASTGAEYAIFWKRDGQGQLQPHVDFEPPERIAACKAQFGTLFTAESCARGFGWPVECPPREAVLLTRSLRDGHASLAGFPRDDLAVKYGICSVVLVPGAEGILEYGARAHWDGLQRDGAGN